MLRDRRAFVSASVSIALATLVPRTAAAVLDDDANVVPPRPARPTPGRPGDFAFLTGEWRIRNRQRRASGAWEDFDGAATVHSILGGVGSVEELRIPARDFAGMGLRLLDLDKRVWSDYWVNAKSGVLGEAGLTGSFENGAGVFMADDEVDGKRVIYAGIWDRITPASCRWRQSASKDGGSTWDTTWTMAWTRVK